MRTLVEVRQLRDPRKPHARNGDHSACCEYVECIVWTDELPPCLERGRTDVQQIQ